MNTANIIVFDFETGGLNPYQCVPIQIAALVLNARTLDPIPKATFSKVMRPVKDDDLELIEEQALQVNRKTREEIKAAPLENIVWKQFSKFVEKYKNNEGDLPIPAGQNIQAFDLIISGRLCEKYGPWDNKRHQQGLFNRFHILDTKNMLFSWFENSNELEDVDKYRPYALDSLRKYFGISDENAHDAFKDVLDTAWIVRKLLLLHRQIAPRVQFRGAALN